MAALRETAESLGFGNVRTYVASGNLVFDAGKQGDALEKMLERAIADRFGFPVDVVIRSARQWAAHAAANPFPAESEKQPNYVHMSIGKENPAEADVKALAAKAAANERVEAAGGAIWIWYGDGAGRSKIGTVKSSGIWTARNWRTVQALLEMLQE